MKLSHVLLPIIIFSSSIAPFSESTAANLEQRAALLHKDQAWFLDASFNGTKSSCLLDTGNFQNAIPAEAFEASLNWPIDSIWSERTSKDWRIMHLHFGAIDVTTSGTRPESGGIGVGIVGMPAFEQRAWKFDLEQNYIALLDGIPAARNAQKMARSSEGHFAIPVEIGNNRVLALVDTGQQPGIWVDRSIYDADSSIFKDCVDSSQQGETGPVPIKACSGFSIRVGGSQVNNLLAIVMDFSKDKNFRFFLEQGWKAAIGEPVLVDKVWDFDFKNQLWSLEEPHR